MEKNALWICLLIVVMLANTTPAAVYQKQQLVSIQYGSEEGQVGMLNNGDLRAGPDSFYVDKNGTFYILDSVNQAVKKYSNKGKLISEKKIGFAGNDLAVADNGDTYILDRCRQVIELLDSDSKSKKSFKLNKRQVETLFAIRLDNNQLSMVNADQDETALFEGTAQTTERGMKGSSGKKFKTLRNHDAQGEIHVMDNEGTVLDELVLPVDNVASIIFLGQDKDDNIYLQVEVSDPETPGVKLSVYVLNSTGEFIESVIENLPNDYSFWTAKLLQIDHKGNIYQMLPRKNCVEINVWQRQK